MKNKYAEYVAQQLEEHGQMVFATAYRILGNADDAEDAMQEVFLKVLKKLTWYLNPDKPRDWGAFLRVMAARQAIDIFRRKKSRKETALEPVEPFVRSTGNNPRQTAVMRERIEQLRGALKTLPKNEAWVFVLKYIEGLSYDQIAAHTGFSVSFTGVLLHRARKRLKTILEPLPAAENQQQNSGALAVGKEKSRA
ncbi:RNA polymerase sigma factor [Candidatus Sumerlaeota bacterium]|nr:RNA polymerase sigma factor [Candidatus Sumerlaeota bacterium]